jgi:hypothetical protein
MEDKKIIDVLMDDDKWVKKEDRTEKSKIKIAKVEEEKKEVYLSEIEKNVLRVIIMGVKGSTDIIRFTAYPGIIVRGAIERLISKGYIDDKLNPTEKAKTVKFKRPVKIKGYSRDYKVVALDLAILITSFVFLVAVIYYLGLIG